MKANATLTAGERHAQARLRSTARQVGLTMTATIAATSAIACAMSLLGGTSLLGAVPLPLAEAGAQVSAQPASGRTDATVEPAALRIAMAARAIQPGEVVRLDIELPEAASTTDPTKANAIATRRQPVALTARAFGREMPVIAIAPGRWRLLIGIDLDTPPGSHAVTLDTRDAAGRRLSQSYPLLVIAKRFPVRRLRVDKRFVDPPAAAQPRIARDRARLAAAFAASAAAPLWRGPFVMPIDTAVISNFGARSVFNGVMRQPHGGADLASPTGTPIAAPNAGRVVVAGDLYFTGNTVVIDHGAGLFSLLAHLSRIDVAEGETVARGAEVGAVGATGRVTGPHLHWTVRLGEARVDPVSLISALARVADATDAAASAR